MSPRPLTPALVGLAIASLAFFNAGIARADATASATTTAAPGATAPAAASQGPTVYSPAVYSDTFFSCNAFPTSAPLWGGSGLGIIPTTTTVPAGQLLAGLDYERISPVIGRTIFGPVVSGTFGFHHGEAGIGYLHEHDTGPGVDMSSNDEAAFAKYRVYRNSHTGGAVAVGVDYIDLDGPGHIASFYAVGSLPLTTDDHGGQLIANLGAINQSVDIGGTVDRTRPMGGLEYSMPCGLTVAGDYIPRDSQSVSLFSVVARYNMKNGLAGQIGYGRQRGTDSKIFGGIAYALGRR